ncbi:hypothetical protein MHYP_G00066650 [Metynnis hypsauchen]
MGVNFQAPGEILTGHFFCFPPSPFTGYEIVVCVIIKMTMAESCMCSKTVICAIEVHTPASIYLCSVKKPSGHGGTESGSALAGGEND